MINIYCMRGRSAFSACAVIILAAVIAGCSGHTDDGYGISGTSATPASAAVASVGTTIPERTPAELSVAETPWWQLQTTAPQSSAPPSRGDLPRPPQHFVVSGGVLFEPDSAVLAAGAGSQLGVILAQIQINPTVRIAIDGYTNPNGGLESTAIKLSASRAATVKAWLVANRVSATRIAIHGWGDEHPIYPHPANETERAANRRCEITITAGTP